MMMTMKEVAKTLKISLSMAYALVSRGELACYEIGSCKRVDEKDLLAFLQQQKNEPKPRPKNQSRHF